MSVKFDLYYKIKEAHLKNDTMRIVREKEQRGEIWNFVIDGDVLKLWY